MTVDVPPNRSARSRWYWRKGRAEVSPRVTHNKCSCGVMSVSVLRLCRMQSRRVGHLGSTPELLVAPHEDQPVVHKLFNPGVHRLAIPGDVEDAYARVVLQERPDAIDGWVHQPRLPPVHLVIGELAPRT